MHLSIEKKKKKKLNQETKKKIDKKKFRSVFEFNRMALFIISNSELEMC